MDYVEALVLGLFQGLTEFLPVSSSGHLAVLQKLFRLEDPGANLTFNIAVHAASLLAVVVFVWREIRLMLTTNRRMILILLVATLPVAAVGLTVGSDVVSFVMVRLVLVGFCFLVTAVLLVWLVRLPSGERAPQQLPLKTALWIGVAQCAALLPGVSRSGTTLWASLMAGVRRQEAVRFVFLLAAPAIGGAALVEVIKLGRAGAGAGWPPVGPLAVGMVASFGASLAGMFLLAKLVSGKRLQSFAVYCGLLGLAVIAADLLNLWPA